MIMRKRNLGTQSDREQCRELLKTTQSGGSKERLIALKMGFDPARSLDEIAEVVGRDRSTVQRWFQRFRKGGFEALLNPPKRTGRPSRCDRTVQDYLKTGLSQGNWNTLVQAQEDLKEHFGQSFNYQTLWRWVKKCTGVLRVPRPVHEKRDSQKAQTFKEAFFKMLSDLPIGNQKPVKVWVADESRYGLRSNLRRVWTKKGQKPHKALQSRYQWSYCYGALDVVHGESLFIQTPTVNLQWTQIFLEQLKEHYPEHEHVVVWDGAGFHPKSSEHDSVPEGIHILTLPPYSPELNPIERLWDLIQDHTANKLWSSLEELDDFVAQKLKDWWEAPEKVLRLIGEGWMHLSANDSAR